MRGEPLVKRHDLTDVCEHWNRKGRAARVYVVNRKPSESLYQAIKHFRLIKRNKLDLFNQMLVVRWLLVEYQAMMTSQGSMQWKRDPQHLNPIWDLSSHTMFCEIIHSTRLIWVLEFLKLENFQLFFRVLPSLPQNSFFIKINTPIFEKKQIENQHWLHFWTIKHHLATSFELYKVETRFQAYINLFL